MRKNSSLDAYDVCTIKHSHMNELFGAASDRAVSLAVIPTKTVKLCRSEAMRRRLLVIRGAHTLALLLGNQGVTSFLVLYQ